MQWYKNKTKVVKTKQNRPSSARSRPGYKYEVQLSVPRLSPEISQYPVWYKCTGITTVSADAYAFCTSCKTWLRDFCELENAFGSANTSTRVLILTMITMTIKLTTKLRDNVLTGVYQKGDQPNFTKEHKKCSEIPPLLQIVKMKGSISERRSIDLKWNRDPGLNHLSFERVCIPVGISYPASPENKLFHDLGTRVPPGTGM
eukprot:2962085-Rhodomonas_salina.1